MRFNRDAILLKRKGNHCVFNVRENKGEEKEEAEGNSRKASIEESRNDEIGTEEEENQGQQKLNKKEKLFSWKRQQVCLICGQTGNKV